MGKAIRQYYGYRILIASWCVYFLTTVIQAYGLSVVSTRHVLNSGWNEGVIGYATSACYIAMVLVSTPAAILERTRGFRFAMILGASIGVLTYGLLFLFLNNRYLYVALFLGVGINSSICGMTSASGLINAWFDRNKAFPMSVLLTAGSIGGFIMPMVAQFLTGISIRFCFAVYTCMCAAALVVAALFIKDKPEDVGEVRDGRVWLSAHPLTQKEQAQKLHEDDHAPTLSDCYRTPKLYAIAFLILICRSSNSAVMSYLILFATERGIPMLQATFLLTLYSLGSFFGRVSSGFTGTLPWGRRFHTVLCFSVLTGGTFLLSGATVYPLFVIAMLVMGLGFGMAYSYTFLLPVYCFGHHNFTVLNGVFTSMGIIGGIFFPPMIFAIAHRFGSYGISYGVLAAIFATSAVVAAATPIRMIPKRQTAGTR